MDQAVIVGAGQAGAHAAIALRQSGFSGRILLFGNEAELPHERPPLSKSMLTAEREPPASYFHSAAHYSENDITVLQSAVSYLDVPRQHVGLIDGKHVGYSHLLLATGGRARCLDVPGASLVSTLRTLDDARALRTRLRPGARVVCIGAGVIGLEVASSARARGCDVTVIEANDRVMSRLIAPAMAEWLADLHRHAGVRLLLNAQVVEVRQAGVICADGRLVPADVVIAGIGMDRNVGLARDAGLRLEGGVAVDEFGETDVAGIYAAGDVAAFWVPRLHCRMRLETWRHAQDHGAAVGRAMAGRREPYDPVPWFWTDQHGRNLQVAGIVEAAQTVLRGDLSDPSFSVWHLDAAGIVVGAASVDAPGDVRAAQSLMRSARPVDPNALADLSLTPQKLARLG
ncbi:NAD(P)/FAD-dependent oxidoreductase [Acidisphaera sp. L21]|uniref:NAD(P)/FAD-dependent oxidoreductase n=1 Tax=Acidisphaera sp. L21 TaxID=1641851 RepID=UPI00131BFF55|nr:FAD-dependent oxidoreductase [Acidisphaera sp. L21]